jgi:hypothetical protein
MQKIENRWGHKSLILPSRDFFDDENSLICLKKQSQATWSKELFAYLNILPHLQEKSFEIAKNFKRFEKISSFLLSKLS